MVAIATQAAMAGAIGDAGVAMITVCAPPLGYTFRDSIFNGGTRSIGKSMAGLEIVKMNDGVPTDIVATRRDCLMRNSYGMLGVFSGLVGTTVGFIDIGLILFSTQRRSIGDRLAKTMVGVEGSGHEARKARALARRVM